MQYLPKSKCWTVFIGNVRLSEKTVYDNQAFLEKSHLMNYYIKNG